VGLDYYSALTMAFLPKLAAFPRPAMLYKMSFLASHVTDLDPGCTGISCSDGNTTHVESQAFHCSQCQTFKPPGSHHCRICNRCISEWITTARG
jgi:hypothetical protein